jgi:integral membrane protein (TIGR01906 family)
MAKQKRIFRGKTRRYGPTGSGFYGMERSNIGSGNSRKDTERFGNVADIICAVMIALLILSFAVTFTLNFRTLYASDVKSLDIPAATGYSEEDVYANYDALISYNSVFYKGELKFPTLEMSDSGRTHFAEVKDIFVALQVVLIISLTFSAVLIFLRRRSLGRIALISGGVTFAVPVITLLLFLVAGWRRFFVGFHKLFFGNDLWIFDEDTDPVIRILPDEYFMHCLIMIIAIVIILGALLVVYGAAANGRAKRLSGMWASRYSSDGVKM